MSKPTRKFACATLFCTAAFYPQLLQAQVAPQSVAIDEYGFDVLHMSAFDPGTDDVSIGSGAGRLSYSRAGLVSGYDIGSYFVIGDYPNSSDTIVNLGAISVRFSFSWLNGIPTYTDLSGSGYVLSAQDGSVTAPDGSRYEFNHWSGTPDENDQITYLTKITGPEGSIVKINWTQYNYVWDNGETWNYDFYDRIQSVENGFGYILKLDYQSDIEPIYTAGWDVLTSVTAANKSVEYCNPAADNCTLNPATSPKVTYSRPNSDTLVVSSPGGRTRTYSTTYSGQNGSYTVSGDAAENMQMTWSGYSRTINKNGATATYNFSNGVVTRTESSGAVTVYSLGPVGGPYSRIESVKDPLNRITSYQHDSNNRVTRITYPEGNYTQFIYDSRGNITEERDVSKTPGSPADIIRTAGFDANCSNLGKCNKPNWTKDARGNQTDYTYDGTHGGLLTATAPAAFTGQPRPQHRLSYTQKQAYFKNASGQIVASGEPVHLLSTTSTCANSSNCNGLAEELKTTIEYGPQSAGVANNLLPVSQSIASGDNQIVQTTSIAYDNAGNAVSVDGSLPGAADTTSVRYDAARRVVGIIAADPDGGGARVNAAVRTTYDSQGKVTLVESGTTSGPSDAAWIGFAPANSEEITYDPADRVKTRARKSGGTTYALSQVSYDAGGRIDCEATRMNPAAYGVLPASACTHTTAGSFGPDRIIKFSYNAASETTQVTAAFGTAEAFNEIAHTYSNNGRQLTIKDAENNLTTYEYDGHDRLLKTRYPVATLGAASSSTTDYEQASYDANGNVTQWRLRDGQLINSSYDNLNRLAFKDLPGNGVTDADVTYNYDLLGRLTTAIDTNGHVATLGYDALGRKRTEASLNGGTKTSDYDLAGRRTRVTWPDGFFASYDYDVTGNVTAIRENGAASGVGVLASYAYDNLGRRSTVTRGNGTVTTYGYDPVSRLSSLSQDMSGSAHDQTITLGFNPAGQIDTLTKTNDAYAWGSHYNIDRSYAANGLNQLTNAGATALGYDGRGNLTASGATTFGYNAKNQLIALNGGTQLYYEPLGRLTQQWNGGGILDWNNNEVVAEWNGGSPKVITRRYVPGPGTDETVVWYEGAGLTDRRWLQTDERGSITAITNSSGTAIAINTYDEYGIPAATNIGRFQYAGQTWLPEIGMFNYKARMYSPTLGRFMQTDAIGYADGMNWYNYVGSDPVNYTDPSGLRRTNCVGPSGYPLSCHFHYTSDFVSYAFADIRDQAMAADRNRNNRNPNAARLGQGRATPQKDSVLDSVVKCGADQLGISNLIEADLVRRGLPEAGSKRFVTEGSSRGTSKLSRTLSTRFPQKIPGGRIWTPDLSFAYTFEPSDLRRLGRMSSTVGRAAGRLIPVVSAGLLIYDLAATGICVANEQSSD